MNSWGIVLVIFGVWILIRTVAGGLPQRILDLAKG